MECGGRLAALKEYVRRVTKITTMLDSTGISVRLINFPHDTGFNGITTVGAVDNIMSRVYPSGGTPIGTQLQRKVLQPLLFEKTRRKALKKPLLITTITDGEVRTKLFPLGLRCANSDNRVALRREFSSLQTCYHVL